jgi:hypothetical protein
MCSAVPGLFTLTIWTASVLLRRLGRNSHSLMCVQVIGSSRFLVKSWRNVFNSLPVDIQYTICWPRRARILTLPLSVIVFIARGSTGIASDFTVMGTLNEISSSRDPNLLHSLVDTQVVNSLEDQCHRVPHSIQHPPTLFYQVLLFLLKLGTFLLKISLHNGQSRRAVTTKFTQCSC